MFRVYVSDNFPMVKKVTTVQNQADPALEGKYTLTIRENQVTVEQNEFNGIAKCDPTDSFDLGEGVKIAMGRLLEAKDKAKKEAEAKVIKVGDLVKVVYNGYSFTTYSDWFKTYDNNPDDLIRYAYNCIPEKGTVGKVINIQPRTINRNEMVALLEANDTLYLISPRGLKKVVV